MIDGIWSWICSRSAFRRRFAWCVDALTLVAMVGFCVFACIQAWQIVAIMARNGQVSITAGIPMTIPYASFVVGFGLIAVAAVVAALRSRFKSPADGQGSSRR